MIEKYRLVAAADRADTYSYSLFFFYGYYFYETFFYSVCDSNRSL
jgi:hypothetical protein